jgi:uncharacterized RDD family membrane protein YckC
VAQYAPVAAPDGTLSYYTPSANFVYAGFWLRAAAIMLDMIIVAVPAIALALLAQLAVPSSRWPDFEPLVGLMMHAGVWLYFAMMESSRWQGTVGKRGFGVKVTDMSGERIGFGRATGRHFGKYLSNILLVGFIMAGLTRQKQALHDIISGCLVLRR